MRVAMVCLGNICRSPMAEHVLRGKAETAGLSLHVASAGTGGWHVGEPADYRTVAVLEAAGYTSAHSAQRFTATWFDEYDLILVMDKDNLHNVHALAADDSARNRVRLLREFDPAAPKHAEVPDPYYGTQRDFEHVLALVEAACDGLVDAIKSGDLRD